MGAQCPNKKIQKQGLIKTEVYHNFVSQVKINFGYCVYQQNLVFSGRSNFTDEAKPLMILGKFNLGKLLFN